MEKKMKLLLAMCYLLKWQLAGRKAAREDSGRAIPSRQRGRKSPSERQNWFVARVCSMGRGDMLSSGASLSSVAAVRCLQAGKTKNKKHQPGPESTHANAEEFWPAWSSGPFKLVTYYAC